MSRDMCYRCFWPKSLCWCSSIFPIETRTRFIFLMHPKEFKEEKAATGRFTHLCLHNSEIFMGVDFESHSLFQRQIHDTHFFPVLLYPGKDALSISTPGAIDGLAKGRQLLVVMIDATWRNAQKIFRTNRTLQLLPRLGIMPVEKSRYIIKKQPRDDCLSTIEAAHEVMTALENAGLDTYTRPGQMLDLFARMQNYQIACMLDPARQRYRPGPGRAIARRLADR